MRAALALVVLLLLAGSLRAQSTPPATVTLYRCTDSSGKVSYASTPCAAGAKQEVRTLARPVDAPPPPAAPPAPPTPAPAPPMQTRTVYLVPPKPMFECTTPDGKRYTSDDDRGNPRWVPLWVGGHRPPPRGSGGSVSGNLTLGSGQLSIRSGQPPGHGHPHPHPSGPAIASGTWVRDSCHPLPQQEVCARLRDRRWELVRRYNSALQSERQELTREQRGVEARLVQDCGGY